MLFCIIIIRRHYDIRVQVSAIRAIISSKYSIRYLIRRQCNILPVYMNYFLPVNRQNKFRSIIIKYIKQNNNVRYVITIGILLLLLNSYTINTKSELTENTRSVLRFT